MAFFEYDGMVLEKLIISQKAGIAELIVVLSDEKMRFDRQGPRLTPAGATNMRNLAVSVVQTLEVVKSLITKKRGSIAGDSQTQSAREKTILSLKMEGKGWDEGMKREGLEALFDLYGNEKDVLIEVLTLTVDGRLIAQTLLGNASSTVKWRVLCDGDGFFPLVVKIESKGIQYLEISMILIT